MLDLLRLYFDCALLQNTGHVLVLAGGVLLIKELVRSLVLDEQLEVVGAHLIVTVFELLYLILTALHVDPHSIDIGDERRLLFGYLRLRRLLRGNLLSLL